MSKNAFISLIAKLDRTKSKDQIKNIDLPAISDKLNKLQDNGLKIQCHVDTSSEAVNKLQGELNTLASKLKLNIGVDAKSITKTVTSDTQSNNNTTTSTVKIDKMSAQSQVDELSKILQSHLKGEADSVLTGLVERTKDALGKNAEVWTTWEKTAEGKLNQFSISIKKAEGEVQKFNYTVEKSGKVKLLDFTGSDKGVLKNIEQVSKAAEKLQRQIINLQAGANDKSAPRPITSTESLNKVTQAYNEAQQAINKLKTANASTFNELNNEATRAVDNLKNVISMARNADSAATKLRAKPIETVKKEELAHLNEFVATISQSAIPNISNLAKQAENLRGTLGKVNDKQGLTDYLNQFTALNAEFKALNTQAKVTKDTLNLLDKALADPSLSANKKAIQSLRNDYQYIFDLVGNAKTKADYQEISNMLIMLKSEYDALVESNKRFKELSQKSDERSLQRLKAERDAVKELEQSYQNIRKESNVLNDPKSTNDEKIIAQNKIQAEEAIIAKIKQRLADQNLLVDEVKKELLLLENERVEYDLIAESKRKQREADQAATEQERKRQQALSAISSAYSQMIGLYRKANSPNSSNDVKNEANRQITALQDEIINKRERELADARLLNEETQKEIDGYKQKYNNASALINLENKATESKRHSAKIEKERSDTADLIVRTYREMASLYGKVNNPNKSESVRNEALYQIEQKQALIDTLSVSQQFTAEQEKQIQKAKQGYQNYQRLKDKEDESLNVERIRTEEYNNLLSKIKEYQRILSTFNNSNVVKQNKGNDIVNTQTMVNADLLNQINPLLDTLKGNKNLSNSQLHTIRTQLEALIPELDKATKNSDTLNNSLKDQSVNQAVTRKYTMLKNNIETFANVNTKAINSNLKMTRQLEDGSTKITTFKDEFQRIVTAINDPNVVGNKNAIQQLANDFSNLQGQARSSGLVTNKFFVDMGSQLKMVLNRYISLYAVIGYIRKMVENVKNLDEAMINLRRVTDETESGYIAFLEKANKQSRDLKITTSELVQQTYQWSKLGYELDDALTLSKASTIFSKVADITEEQSLKNLITILKAYGIEAKNVMDVVDKLDNINNKYAVDAAGLGDGLERSASALAMTGNSLEQSIAMLTGAGEITQNLENTGKRKMPVRNYIG